MVPTSFYVSTRNADPSIFFVTFFALPNTFSDPEEIQQKIFRTMKGLEKVEIVRPGYDVEYGESFAVLRLHVSLPAAESSFEYSFPPDRHAIARAKISSTPKSSRTPWRLSRSRAFTSPVRSAAPPDTRRPPPRGSSRGPTPAGRRGRRTAARGRRSRSCLDGTRRTSAS